MARSTHTSDYFQRSALKEVSLLRKHFHISGRGEDVRPSREITPSDIHDYFREYFAFVRPPNLGPDKLLPQPDPSRLRALYVGQPDANLALNLLVRHALYVDQIVIIDPYLTLHFQDIAQRPQVWAEVIINRALCLCALEEWISKGIVLVIPSVFHYAPQLLGPIMANPKAFQPRMTSHQEGKFEQLIILRFLVHELPENRDAALDLLARMGKKFHEGERAEYLDLAREFEAANPIRFRLSAAFYDRYFPAGRTTSQVLDHTLGVPLLLAPVIANEIGAFLIFEHALFYELIAASQSPFGPRNLPLHELAIAFQALNFPVLHNVSVTKALQLRERGYLLSFRAYLRDLWHTVASLEENSTLEVKIREFTDRLTAEYRSLEADWDDIKAELRIKAATSGLVVAASAGAAVVEGGMSWTAGGFLGATAGLLKEQLSGYLGSKARLREVFKHPLSILISLK